MMDFHQKVSQWIRLVQTLYQMEINRNLLSQTTHRLRTTSDPPTGNESSLLDSWAYSNRTDVTGQRTLQLGPLLILQSRPTPTDDTSHHITDEDFRRRHKSKQTSLHRGHNSSPHLSTRMTYPTHFCYSSRIRIWNSQHRMDVAVEILHVHFHPLRDCKGTILFYIERTSLTITSLLVKYTSCILLPPVAALYYHNNNRSLSSVFF